jgi:hypothetical protein
MEVLNISRYEMKKNKTANFTSQKKNNLIKNQQKKKNVK